uniref:non-specific serine/threonine protein kinase n=1 Tax=Parastrongyloides trichosuri TaxID=131310 RepID=A0A0N4ZNL4_PARTI
MTQTNGKENPAPKEKQSKSVRPAFDELIGRHIKGWFIHDIIGKGTFGCIYKCTRNAGGRKSGEILEYAALKSECKTNKRPSSMNKEVSIINAVQKSNLQKKKHFFVKVFENGEKVKFTYIITTLFGPNLFDILIATPNKKIEERTWVRVIYNVLEGLRTLHRRKYIHLDLKPANIVIDYNAVRRQPDVVAHIIDFGLARKLDYSIGSTDGYVEPDVLRTELEEPIWVGSIYHCSPFIHRGYPPTYRDDLYSWLYIAMDLYKELPWNPADSPQEIVKKKFDNTESQLKKYLPPELGCIVGQVINLKPSDKPKYKEIGESLRQYMKLKNICWNEPCEWEPLLQQQLAEKDMKDKQNPKSNDVNDVE